MLTDAAIAAQLALCTMPRTGSEMTVDIATYRAVLAELLERRQRDAQQDDT